MSQHNQGGAATHHTNAFKILLGKGVSLPDFLKSRLREMGCRTEKLPNHDFVVYIGPVDKKDAVFATFAEYKIQADLVPIFHPSIDKPSKIVKLEHQWESTMREEHDQYAQLLMAIEEFNKNFPINLCMTMYDFESPPRLGDIPEEISEENRGRFFTQAMDLHKRVIALKEKQEEKANRENSLRLHENEPRVALDLLEKLNRNEVGDAEVFAHLHRGKYLYDPKEGNGGTFYVWKQTHWAPDVHKMRHRDFDDVAQEYASMSRNPALDDNPRKALTARAFALRSDRRRASVLATVQTLFTFSGAWDQLPGLLPCLNGVIDLKTGLISPSKPEQYIRKICPISYDPSAACPQFLHFLSDIMGGNQELVDFLQRFLGYCLLGIPKEEIIVYWYGSGRNGKGTLAKLIMDILGPFGKQLPAEMLLSQKIASSSSSPNPDVLTLKGARIAMFSEINKNRRIDSAKIKNLSGRDKIAGRHLYSTHFEEFEASHVMIIQTNEKPKAPPGDLGLWERTVLIPFNMSFVRYPKGENERPLNENLKDELPRELQGILNWVLKGCAAYQSSGLGIPQSIRNITESYRRENDSLQLFLEEKCQCGSGRKVPKAQLKEAYKQFCVDAELEPLNQKELTNHLAARFQEMRHSNCRFWEGVEIVENRDH